MTNEFFKNELQEIKNGLKSIQSAFILLHEENEKIKTAIKDQRYDLLTDTSIKIKKLYNQIKHIEIKYNAFKRLLNQDFEEDKREIEELIIWFR